MFWVLKNSYLSFWLKILTVSNIIKFFNSLNFGDSENLRKLKKTYKILKFKTSSNTKTLLSIEIFKAFLEEGLGS